MHLFSSEFIEQRFYPKRFAVVKGKSCKTEFQRYRPFEMAPQFKAILDTPISVLSPNPDKPEIRSTEFETRHEVKLALNKSEF